MHELPPRRGGFYQCRISLPAVRDCVKSCSVQKAEELRVYGDQGVQLGDPSLILGLLI